MKSAGILDIFFPPRCAICDEVVQMGGPHICDRCLRTISYVEEPSCYKCGKELDSEEREYCSDCEKAARTYVKGFPVFNYVSPLSDAIMAFKYQDRQDKRYFFAEAIYDRYSEEFLDLGIEALVPVPISRKKYLTRGYNQAEILAEALSEKMTIPVRNDIIIRNHNTLPQKSLSPEEREKNLRVAFSPGKLKGKLPETVLLVDDIYTTGATIEGCTGVCRKLGIKKVYYTSIAIGKTD